MGVGVEETLRLNPPRAGLSLIVWLLMLHGCTVYAEAGRYVICRKDREYSKVK